MGVLSSTSARWFVFLYVFIIASCTLTFAALQFLARVGKRHPRTFHDSAR